MGLLRTLLAISVVFAHSAIHEKSVFVGGKIAVELFYLISGFLISYVLSVNQTYRRKSRFYLSRALRLYPVYYFVALLSFMFAWVYQPSFIAFYKNIPAVASTLLCVTNFTLLGQDWDLFAAINEGSLVYSASFASPGSPLYLGLVVPQAWTLGIELSFYLLAPFILRKPRLILAVFVLSASIKAFLFSRGIGQQDPWSYRFFPAEVCFFMLGAMSHRIALPLWRRRLTAPRWQALPLHGTIVLAALIVSYFLIPVPSSLKGAMMIMVFAIFLPLAFIYQDNSAIDRSIGELSYPVYIGHVLVISVISFSIDSGSTANPVALSLVEVAASLLFAYVLNMIIARPLEQYRSIIKSKVVPVAEVDARDGTRVVTAEESD